MQIISLKQSQTEKRLFNCIAEYISDIFYTVEELDKNLKRIDENVKGFGRDLVDNPKEFLIEEYHIVYWNRKKLYYKDIFK